MILYRLRYHVVAVLLAIAPCTAGAAPLKALFLGDQGHHRPAERAAQMIPVLAGRGVEVRYTENTAELNLENLRKYDALILYANTEKIEPAEEEALLQYVAQGGGFVPLHCASYCFLNSPKYIALVGGQFQRHGAGMFRVKNVAADHPIMQGYDGFESWDETYVHHKHNETGRTVLEVRESPEGREPWTWVRNEGKGRVFYTAWGHDARTWGNPGFQNLVERGIRWAAGGNPADAGEFIDEAAFPVPEMTKLAKDLDPFEFKKENVPFYPPGEKWGTIEKGQRDMQLPLAPEASLKHMVTPVGFHVELFCSEPDVTKPIAMTWDERGRLWVCETIDYPNELQPAGEGRDRIKICEDTNGDGRADKFTVFADKLSIPTSLTFSRGGVIVQNATETLYLNDTDGDERADERRVLFSGWNARDTHGGVSNFQYGLDNWIWAMQGYNDSAPTVQGQEQQAFRMGFFRFRPDGSELEFVRSTNNNTWGLGISEEGLLFGSTANHNPSVYMPIANRYYEQVRGWSASGLGTIADSHLFQPITDKVRQVDQHGGYTAGAGHALYTARNYPKEYWNRTAFVCGPTGHLVGTFVLSPAGADFKSTSPFNLLASDDEWNAPIMAEVGPDGNVWVLDWYNYIVQHNPTPAGFETGKGNAYETDLRDKRHGRIYRIVYDEAKPSEPTSLADASPNELVAALKHDNFFWRRQAQRLLVERGEQDVVPPLRSLIADPSTDAIGLNPGAMHAIWTLHGLGAVEKGEGETFASVAAALRHPSAGVRRAALLTLPPDVGSAAEVVSAGSLTDKDAQVRLAAFLALADMPPSPAAATAILAAIERPENLDDAWIPDAATSAAAAHAQGFLAALATRERDTAPADKILAMASRVAEHYARGAPIETAPALLGSLASARTDVLETIVTGLSKGWPRDKPVQLDPLGEKMLVELYQHASPAARGPLFTLAGLWKNEALNKFATEISAGYLKAIKNEQASDAERLAAAKEMISFARGDAKLVEVLLGQITPQLSAALATGFIDAAALSESPQAGAALIDRLGAMTPQVRGQALGALFKRGEWTVALLDAIETGKVLLTDLPLDRQQALASYPDDKIAQRAKALLAKGGGLPNPDRQKVIDELGPLVLRTADAAAGKEVFKKQCAKCHIHSGEGAKIGPDLTGMAAHPKHELLIHILDPSRSVEGNFRQYAVVTIDGLVLTGMLTSESKTAIELADSEGKLHQVLREDIDELSASRSSVMPEGFEKQVPPAELANLLEFLAQRGKYLPLDLAKAATAVSTRGMFHDEASTVERLVFDDWGPKTFAGVPFQLVDPRGDKVRNVVLLQSPNGKIPPQMPKSVVLPCNGPVRTVHLLSGVGGWNAKTPRADGGVSMIVRLHYDDGQIEDHSLRDGQEFADYIGHFDVPGSKLAFKLGGRQIRYLAVHPQRSEAIRDIEFVKGPDRSAPIVMAVTVESP